MMLTKDFGEAEKIGDSLYVIKTVVSIGEGPGHLTHSGLRDRFLQNLENGRQEKFLQTDKFTNLQMLKEETQYIQEVKQDKIQSFGIDTTTTVIQLQDGSLVLHSPGKATENLVQEVQKLGTKIAGIIAPNLQHWLGCQSWANLYPEAIIYVAPAAEGECLLEKLGLESSPRARVLDERGRILTHFFRIQANF